MDISVSTGIMLSFILLCVAGIFFFVGYTFYSSHKRKLEIYKKWEEEDFAELPVNEIGARIMKKRVDITYRRSAKHPENKVSFYFTFLTDAGKTVEYEVPKELYEAYNEFETGTLFTREDSFVDFGERIDIK